MAEYTVQEVPLIVRVAIWELVVSQMVLVVLLLHVKPQQLEQIIVGILVRGPEDHVLVFQMDHVVQ